MDYDSLDYLRCESCGEETHISNLDNYECERCRHESEKERREREMMEARESQIARSNPWAQ